MAKEDPVPEGKTSYTDHQKTLCEELWMLRTEGALCDVILDVSGERLMAHRVVLSACSAYLKTCCTNANSKTRDGFFQIKIQSCSYKVCLKILEHLYTGHRISLPGDLVEEFNNLCEEWKLKQPLMAPVSVEEPDKETSNLGSESQEADAPPVVEANADPKDEPYESDADTEIIGESLSPVSVENNQPDCEISRESKRRPSRKRKIDDHFEYDPHDAPTESKDDGSWSNDEAAKKSTPKRNSKKKQPLKAVKNKKDNSRVPKSKPKAVKPRMSTGRPVGRPRKPPDQKYRKFVCRDCDLEFKQRKIFARHRKECHKESWTCEECKCNFVERNQLLAHNVENHFKEGMELPTIYRCQVAGCEYTTHKRMSWYNHRYHAHPSERSICDICGKSLKNEITLKQHKLVVHPKSPRKDLPCPECEKIFKTEPGLQKHREIAHKQDTTERAKLVCPYCAHTCVLSESLNEHLYKKHDILPPSKKSYKCQICDFKTTHKAEMRKHNIRHKPDEEKPFPCDICDKRFVDRGSLATHQLKHDTGENPYKCQYCDYSTKYTHNLRQHTQVKHENKDYKPFECDECSYRSSCKGNLYKHLRNVHKRTVRTKYTVVRDPNQQLSTNLQPVQDQPQPPPPTDVPMEVPQHEWHIGSNVEVTDVPGIWTLQTEQELRSSSPAPSHNTQIIITKQPLQQTESQSDSEPALNQTITHYQYVHTIRTDVGEADQNADSQSQALASQHQIQLPHTVDMNTLLYPYPGF